MYPQYNRDIVNYDGQETYNITKSNLLTAEAKIAELTYVADSQKIEIMKLKSHLENFQYSNDNTEFIKTEMTMMADQVKKAQDSYNNLLEIIKKKGNC